MGKRAGLYRVVADARALADVGSGDRFTQSLLQARSFCQSIDRSGAIHVGGTRPQLAGYVEEIIRRHNWRFALDAAIDVEGAREMHTEFGVAPTDADIVRKAASELGLKITHETEERGAGTEAWTYFRMLLDDPFVQGALFGFLIAQGVVIRKKGKGAIVITIKSFAELKDALRKRL